MITITYYQMNFPNNFIELLLLMPSLFVLFPFSPSYLWQVIVKAFLRYDGALPTENCTEFTEILERIFLPASKILLRVRHDLSVFRRKESLDWWERRLKSLFNVRSMNLRVGELASFLAQARVETWKELRLIVVAIFETSWQLFALCGFFTFLCILVVLGTVYNCSTRLFSLD